MRLGMEYLLKALSGKYKLGTNYMLYFYHFVVITNNFVRKQNGS